MIKQEKGRAITMGRSQWHIIGRGKVGWHADAPNVRSSGGDIEPRVWHVDGSRMAPYQETAREGAPVYDAIDADYEAFARFVIRGPMVDCNLAPDEWDKLGHDDPLPKSLDSVGVERYVNLLRARVPGVRFGRVHNGEIEWES
jgi:hypothetical protein